MRLGKSLFMDLHYHSHGKVHIQVYNEEPWVKDISIYWTLYTSIYNSLYMIIAQSVHEDGTAGGTR